MGNSSSVPYPRYGWCISAQTTDHCLENHVDPLPPRPVGSTKRRDSKSRHRRSVSAVFSFSTGAEGALPPPEGPEDEADVTSLDLTTSPAHEDLININTASEEELMTLSGVNRATARAIVDYRRQIGGFRRIGDLALVTGIGATRFQQIRPEICVGRIPRSTSGYGVGGERSGMTRNSSASSSGIDMSADSASARSTASQLQLLEQLGLQQLNLQQFSQQQLGKQQLGQQQLSQQRLSQQQLGQEHLGQQQLSPQQLNQQQLGQQKPDQRRLAVQQLSQQPQQLRQCCSCSDSLCHTYGELSLGNKKELEILMKYSSEDDRTRVSDLSLKSHKCDAATNRLSASAAEPKFSSHMPRSESSSTRRSLAGFSLLTSKSKRRQSPSSRSEKGQSSSGRHSRQPSATFTDVRASVGCYPPPVSPIRAIQSSADISPHAAGKSRPRAHADSDSRSCSSYGCHKRDDFRGLDRIESSPCYLEADRKSNEGHTVQYCDVVEDFMRLYGPLLQKSSRPLQATHTAASDLPQGQGRGFRVAAWDLDGCGAEKVSNAGVKEVIALTILENQFTILALHNLTEADVVLKTICDEINSPTVPTVRRWSARRGLWHYVTASCETATCGFLYNIELVGNVHQPPHPPGVSKTDAESCHLANDIKAAEYLFTATFEVAHSEITIAILSHYAEATTHSQTMSADALLKDTRSLILIGRVPDHLHCNLIQLTDEQPNKEENRREINSSIWVNHQTSRLYSGQTCVIDEGLTSPWIPQGWTWGGAVSQTGPVFSEFFLPS